MEVNLLDYLPEFCAYTQEFKAIVNAEEQQMYDIWNNCNDILNNAFIQTANQYAVERFESMLDIKNTNTDLEIRKIKILSILNGDLPYTLNTLKNKIFFLCGNYGFIVDVDYNNYVLSISLEQKNKSKIDILKDMIKNIVPANMIFTIDIKFNKHYQIRNFSYGYLKGFTYTDVREKSLNKIF